MAERKTSILDNSLIWFGAGVSIAEILTGTYFAPLGFTKGLAAILVGHAIGCSLLFLAGYIGAISRKSSMVFHNYRLSTGWFNDAGKHCAGSNMAVAADFSSAAQDRAHIDHRPFSNDGSDVDDSAHHVRCSLYRNR